MIESRRELWETTRDFPNRMIRILLSFQVIASPRSIRRSLIKQCTISTAAAKSMLGFTEHCQPTIRELRHAYFEAAKLHHPDVLRQRQNEQSMTVLDFRDITIAYEHLLQSPFSQSPTSEPIITVDEEEEYRTACLEILGIPAEIVEESKKNPIFRQWLMGKTDAAMHWKMFLSQHGGLAEKLRPRVQLAKGDGNGVVRKVETRRRKKR